MEAIKPVLSDYIVDHDVIYKAMLEAFVGFAKDRLKAFGKDELLEQPEFANDASKMRKILELLNKPDVFREADIENESGSVSIHIGGDDDDVSIVQAKVKMPGKQERSIAVVGPKRMDYDKVVSSLEYLIEELEQYHEGMTRKEKDSEREGKERKDGSK